jgi:hypothetical protein
VNIVLWVLQVVLALYNVMGGFWTLKTADKLAATGNHALPKSAWQLLAVLQIVFALGLVVPGAAGVLPGWTAIAAICLAVEMVATAAIVHSKSLVSTGMLWAVIPSILAAFVAYGRWMLIPM